MCQTGSNVAALWAPLLPQVALQVDNLRAAVFAEFLLQVGILQMIKEQEHHCRFADFRALGTLQTPPSVSHLDVVIQSTFVGRLVAALAAFENLQLFFGLVLQPEVLVQVGSTQEVLVAAVNTAFDFQARMLVLDVVA